MAADDAAVVVTLHANLKDYESALKSAVRATERAAAAAEKAVSGIGKGKAFTGLNDNFKKSAGQIANDARIMQFQLNDIFSGLASGQGIRAVQQQLGQIAQQLGGGGIRAAAGTLGTAMIGMINPINLAVVAFGVLATVAANYFSDTEKDAQKASDELDKQATTIEKLAEKYGNLFPELERAAKAAREQADAAGKAIAQQTALERAYADTSKTIGALQPNITKVLALLQDLGVPIEAIEELRKRWVELGKAIEEHRASSEDAKKVIEPLNGLIKDQAGRVSELAKVIRDDLVQSFIKLDEAAASAGETIQRSVADTINKMVPLGVPGTGNAPGSPIGPPITSGAGVFNPSQTQMEMAKKAREDAERAAKDAAREAERAAAENKREAERAAKEAADRLNKAIVNQTSVAVDAVTGMLGQQENVNRGSINAFLKAGGVDLDAATTAWCAAFVNSALAQVGIKGTGSNVATSFANWGKGVPLGEVRRGDVLVEQRGRRPGQEGGHVGFATGQLRATADGIQQIEMISGNASDKVQKDWVDATDVIARRAADAFQVPADALTHLSDESKAAAEASKKLADQQAKTAQQIAQTIEQMATGAITGFISDLRNGVSAGEAFNNMLNRILDSLIQIGVQMAVKSLFGGLGLGVAHGGGSVSNFVGAGQRKGVSPLIFAGAPRYAAGGMVGLRPGEIPIIAHRGEIIIPNARRLAGGGRTPAQTISTSLGDVNIDMSQTGLVAADNDSAKQFGLNLQKIVHVEMVRESRPGGLLRKIPG